MHKTFGVLLLLVAAFVSPAHANDEQPCSDATVKAVAALASQE
jgi:hypothetical protein